MEFPFYIENSAAATYTYSDCLPNNGEMMKNAVIPSFVQPEQTIDRTFRIRYCSSHCQMCITDRPKYSLLVSAQIHAVNTCKREHW